jgi:hypothetical protein
MVQQSAQEMTRRRWAVMGPVDWGNAPGWASVVVALIALLFAGLGARAAIRGNANQQEQLEHQQKQLDEADEDKRREQANKVAAWVEISDNKVAARLVINNGSDLPVYNVRVLTFGDISNRAVQILKFPTLGPGKEYGQSFGIPLEDISIIRATIQFSDAAGVRWTRGPDGQLGNFS